VSLSLGGSGENAVSDQNIDFKAVENDSFECLRLKDSNPKKERLSSSVELIFSMILFFHFRLQQSMCDAQQATERANWYNFII